MLKIVALCLMLFVFSFKFKLGEIWKTDYLKTKENVFLNFWHNNNTSFIIFVHKSLLKKLKHPKLINSVTFSM